MTKVTTVDERINMQGIRYIDQSRSVNHSHSGVHGNSNGRANFKEL
jgi:hypothetical protein